MKKFFLFCFLAFSLTLSAATTQFKGCLYTVDANNIKISWTAGQNVDYYEVQLIWIDKNTNYPIVTTTSNNISLPRPRAGIFKVRVRSCNNHSKSVWIESDNSVVSKVDGQNMAWIVYWKLPSPGGIVVE